MKHNILWFLAFVFTGLGAAVFITGHPVQSMFFSVPACILAAAALIVEVRNGRR
jgi:hypothetical protein